MVQEDTVGWVGLDKARVVSEDISQLNEGSTEFWIENFWLWLQVRWRQNRRSVKLDKLIKKKTIFFGNFKFGYDRAMDLFWDKEDDY